jgi:hypothetical protein
MGERVERGRHMPTPIPATDAQLRQLAERGAQRWADNVLGDFDRH